MATDTRSTSQDEVRRIINERQYQHGDFSDSAATFLALQHALRNPETGAPNLYTAEQHYALTMILAKISRIAHGNSNFLDHWRDIAGYATLAADSLALGYKRSEAMRGEAVAPPPYPYGAQQGDPQPHTPTRLAG